MSEVNDRMIEIRRDRKEYRRKLDAKMEKAEPVVVTEGHVAALNASFKRDPDRWHEGYVARTATQLHRRATAPSNGRVYTDVFP